MTQTVRGLVVLTATWATTCVWSLSPSLLVVRAAAPTAAVVQNDYYTPNDLQRLEDYVVSASREIEPVQSRDKELASRLKKELESVLADVHRFKAKFAANEQIYRDEWNTLRQRVQDVQLFVMGDTIPADTELDFTLEASIRLDATSDRQRFEASLAAPFRKGSRSLLPADSYARGHVAIQPSTGANVNGAGVVVAFDEIVVRGKTYSLRGAVRAVLGGGPVAGPPLPGIQVTPDGTIAAAAGSTTLGTGTRVRVALTAPLSIR